MAHVLVRPRAALGLAALAAGLVLAPAALAAPAPYADWTFKVRRANEAGDLEALAEVVRERPLFARIWFYGQVFDLVTPGVSDAVKDALRPRLKVVADVLANGEPPDLRPALFLDRAAHGDLEQHARAARKLQDDLIDAVRQNNPTPAWLAPAVAVEVAESVVYGLLLRAEIASKRLGGEREKAHLVAVARRMAEGFALGQGDLRPWRTLATYLGLPEDGMTSDADNVVELKLADALNARAGGDLTKARAAMQVALDTTRAARGGGALTALLMNGTAHADAWLNDRAGERRKRLAVLQAVRPLGEPTLVALVAGQMVQAHLADQSVADLMPYLREMRALGEPVTGVGLHLRTLKAAADALRQAGDARIEAGDFDGAERLIGEADATYLLLADPTAVRVTTPKAKVEKELQDRVRARARLLRDRARIARRRADAVGARGLLEKALAVYVDTLKDAGGAGATETALAQLAVDIGDPDLALTHTQRARDHLNRGGTEADRARNYLAQGRARLARGDLPQAFANANEGLETLKTAGDTDAALRARLHLLAAGALEAAGYAEAADGRYRYARSLAPSTLAVARAVASARLAGGDPDGALAALDPVRGGEHAARVDVLRGCVLARAGRPAEALKALPDPGRLSLPHQRRDQLTARICATAAHLAKGDTRAAKATLAPARALVLELPDPMLVWRVRTLEALIALKGRDWLDAAKAGQAAVAAWTESLGEQPARGVVAALRPLAAPATPDELIAQLPDIMVQAAGRDRRNQAAWHAAAAGHHLWARQWAARPAGHGRLEVAGRPDADRAIRAALAQLAAARTLLEDRAVARADRVQAVAWLQKGSDALRAGVTALPEAAPAWAGWLVPQPRPLAAEGKVSRLVYRVGERASDLWIATPGAPVRWFRVPGASVVARLLKPVQDVIAGAPAAWEGGKKRDPNARQWAALARPVRGVMPFVRDRALMAKLSEGPVEVFADGPLLGFPLGALVLAAPNRKQPGSPPTYAGVTLDLRYRLTAQPLGALAGGAGGPLVFGPLPAASAGCPVADCAAPGADAAALVAAVGASPAVLSGEAATAGALQGALAGHGALVLSAPLDPTTGGAVTAPAAGEAEAGYGRLRPAEWGFAPNAVGVVALTQTPEVDGWLRFAAAAAFAGTPTVVARAIGGADDPLPAELLRDGAAWRAARRRAMGAGVDPALGGPVLHHPSRWARWVRFETPGAGGPALQGPPAPAVAPMAPAPEAPAAPAVEAPAAPVPTTPAAPAVEAPAAPAVEAPAAPAVEAPAAPAVEAPAAPAADPPPPAVVAPKPADPYGDDPPAVEAATDPAGAEAPAAEAPADEAPAPDAGAASLDDELK